MSTQNPPPTPTIGNNYLPTRSAVSNPTLTELALQAADTSDGLDHSHRQVLCAVIPRLRFPPEILSRIAGLSPSEMKTLAEVFYEGLVLARNWGGRKHNTGSASRRESCAIQANDEGEGHTTPDRFHTLATALGVHHVFGPRHADSTAHDDLSRRQNIHRTECLARQMDRCCLTLTTSHSASRAYTSSRTRSLQRRLLGVDCQLTIWELAGGTKSWRCSNGIAVDPALHKLFDQGNFVLLPLAGYVPGSRQLDVVFWWRTSADIAMRTTILPRDPQEQVYVHEQAGESERKIRMAGDGKRKRVSIKRTQRTRATKMRCHLRDPSRRDDEENSDDESSRPDFDGSRGGTPPEFGEHSTTTPDPSVVTTEKGKDKQTETSDLNDGQQAVANEHIDTIEWETTRVGEINVPDAVYNSPLSSPRQKRAAIPLVHPIGYIARTVISPWIMNEMLRHQCQVKENRRMLREGRKRGGTEIDSSESESLQSDSEESSCSDTGSESGSEQEDGVFAGWRERIESERSSFMMRWQEI
ncbi:hypothetical protein K440DRAFT_665372 [Wilcoxina mikolae CBS 423.85]|nr:hypothetical protein K440DRAFT_665372 [Wilcoxina mikolae CBS 423.85]